VKIKWWDRKWRLILFAILLPVLFVPIIGVLLFPEIPLLEFLFYGLIFSVVISQIFRLFQTVEVWGLRIVILVLGGLTLVALLLVFVRIML